jgi:hypothetical protein
VIAGTGQVIGSQGVDVHVEEAHAPAIARPPAARAARSCVRPPKSLAVR